MESLLISSKIKDVKSLPNIIDNNRNNANLRILDGVVEIRDNEESQRILNEPQTTAVEIKHGYKSYGKCHVLKDLNLYVPKGAIYGLLGPSGCGKTTILRAICGRVELDKGSITVFDSEPGSKESGIPGPVVGYMPQEIALYNEFSIDETLNYFGYLHNLKKDHLNRRKQFLLSFLDLNEAKTRLVKVLSGGQKRRVSMMCALLQEPQLLILDEPTVGVDPLLREKIWDHLIDISTTSHTTIMITTHYIEEARKADRVGLIRNGRILAEDNPESLLKVYNESTLENVFLKLCVKDQNVHNDEEIVNDVSTANSLSKYTDEIVIKQAEPVVETKTFKKRFYSKPKQELSRLLKVPQGHNLKGLLYKNSLLMRRDIGFLFFEFLIPVIQITLFCTCIGREPYDLQFGVVNNETIYNSSYNFSNIYIDQLSKHTFDFRYLDWKDAYTLTRKGDLWGFFDISQNFSQDTIAKFTNPLSKDSFNGSFINLYLDASSQQIALIVQAKAVEAYQAFLAEFLKLLDFPINPTILQSPINVPNPIYGDKDPQFVNFMIPGVMTTIIFSLSIGFTALLFVLEKKDGLLDRSWVAGVTTAEIMIAYVMAKLITMIVQIALLIVMATFAFNVDIKGPFIVSAILLMLQGFCGMSYGLALSAFSDDERQVLEMAVGTIFPSLLLSGILWPIEGMPKWVRLFTNFSPLTRTAEAMRSIASRGWGLTSFSVWFGLVAVTLWSLFFNFIAAVVFTIRQ